MSNLDESLDTLSKTALRIADERNAFKAECEAQKEQLARWMIRNGFATGHGDTFEDLLSELDWQITELQKRA